MSGVCTYNVQPDKELSYRTSAAGASASFVFREVTTVYEAKLKADMKRSEKKSESGKSAAAPKAAQSEEEIIKGFCTDMTELAEKGKLEPVLGRNKEIREVVTVSMPYTGLLPGTVPTGGNCCLFDFFCAGVVVL